jgi:hypothetical protein
MGRTIRLHARPLPPPSTVSKLDRKMRKRDNLLTGEGGEGAGVEPNHMTTRKLGPLWGRVSDPTDPDPDPIWIPISDPDPLT